MGVRERTAGYKSITGGIIVVRELLYTLYQCQYPGCALYYGLARYCHWGKVGEGQRKLSILFLTTAYESTIISKGKFKLLATLTE